MKRTACIGECMVELSEHPGGSLTRAFGGDTLNTAIYLARLGVPVDYVTALGDDPHSEAMLAAWSGGGRRHRPSSGTRVPAAVPGLYLIQHRCPWRAAASPTGATVGAGPAVCSTLPGIGAIRHGRPLPGPASVYLSGITLSLFAGPASRDRLFAAARPRHAPPARRIAFDTNFRPTRLARPGRGAGRPIGRAIRRPATSCWPASRTSRAAARLG